jgi:DNA-directed RNA polymerase-3 subunit RPC5
MATAMDRKFNGWWYYQLSDIPIAPQPIEDSDDDELLAEYDVFLTPELQEQLYLLQYPDRRATQPYNESTKSRPLEMRLKPTSGFMEVDIGTNVTKRFNKAKGIEWGRTLREAKESGTNAFGLASGFGKGARTNEILTADRAQLTRPGNEEEQIRILLQNYDLAVEDGAVIDKMTLGGQILPSEKSGPKYMLGVFKNSTRQLYSIEPRN